MSPQKNIRPRSLYFIVCGALKPRGTGQKTTPLRSTTSKCAASLPHLQHTSVDAAVKRLLAGKGCRTGKWQQRERRLVRDRSRMGGFLPQTIDSLRFQFRFCCRWLYWLERTVERHLLPPDRSGPKNAKALTPRQAPTSCYRSPCVSTVMCWERFVLGLIFCEDSVLFLERHRYHGAIMWQSAEIVNGGQTARLSMVSLR